jgi:hypothetical protein
MVVVKSQTLLSTIFSGDSIPYLLPYPELGLSKDMKWRKEKEKEMDNDYLVSPLSVF